ncbi:MAG: hypothetical protein ACREXX_12475 [Gammaproteobacteria bacterium]
MTDEIERPLALVTDDEVSVMDGRRVASRFRELEVELDPSAPSEVAEDILARLRDAGAGPVANVPKIVRALGARAEEPPDVVVPDLEGDKRRRRHARSDRRIGRPPPDPRRWRPPGGGSRGGASGARRDPAAPLLVVNSEDVIRADGRATELYAEAPEVAIVGEARDGEELEPDD